MSSTAWCQKSVQETLEEVKSNSTNGLNTWEVKQRQRLYNNRLEEHTENNPLVILLRQFTDTMVLVLLGATAVSGMIGAMADAVTIMAIVIINAILGFIQEYRAERSLEEIKKLAAPYAYVLREGRKIKILADELVPGDIVFIEAGDKVPADLRLIESYSLLVDESALTGESVPVEKASETVLPKDTPLAEQRNLVFMGTAVSRGRAAAVVVATGMQTVMGNIANMMKSTEHSLTPLQAKLDQLGKVLIVICLFVCTVVTILGIYRGEDIMTMLLAGISLAVAAIPEGLPAIVTVVLALGVQRMAKRNAIIRKLPAVETLGCTTIICSDKTGTLTQNRMTVKKLATFDYEVEVDGDGYQEYGEFHAEQKKINPLADMGLRLIMETAVNCNNSRIEKEKGNYVVHGDPTEAALLIMAKKAGLHKRYRKIREIPFDSERKKMSTIVEIDGENWLLCKGALDILSLSCTKALKNKRVVKLSAGDRKKLLHLQEQWAGEAFRVLGFAYKKLDSNKSNSLLGLSDKKLESELILIGICAMMDPPKKGVADSVEKCINAGVIPIMITGDHPVTAAAIALELGISSSDEVINGREIDRLTDSKLYKKALESRVFARVSPEHKNRIVKVLKAKDHVVAMTGDGVNDAPAVKAADIGISMGISGTQVTREASSMILADDDFSTIVSAVHEGRAIYDNIRKFIRYLLGCNIGEVLVMFLASLLGMPLPLLPIQILWINLVTDGLPAMALGLEPAEPEIMKQKPRSRTEGIFARKLGWIICKRGVFISIITLLSFSIGMIYCRYQGINELDLARTMAFTTLVFAQLFYVFECRSEKYSPFELGFSGNKYLLAAVLCSVLMQLSVLYIPSLKEIFNTVSLEWWSWLIILSLTGFKFFGQYILYTWQRIIVSPGEYVKINV
jgi:Ca2+-transporting ATPase